MFHYMLRAEFVVLVSLKSHVKISIPGLLPGLELGAWSGLHPVTPA